MRPLIKWAGGKRWLLPVLEELWQPHKDLTLVEPFTGGMAVALGLAPKRAILNDANEHLINLYLQVRDGLIIKRRLKNQAEYYYAMRAKFNRLIQQNKHLTSEAAIIFYFLIRTGFNGLCRFNNSGEFNVPFGQHNSIRYKDDFLDYQTILKNWQLQHGDFAKIKLTGAEFIYADPPYDVEFTRYTSKDFTWTDQERLAQWLAKHPGPVIASNQATKRIIELYKDLNFKVKTLPAPRMISCNGDRKPAIEVLIFNNIKQKIALPNVKANCLMGKNQLV